MKKLAGMGAVIFILLYISLLQGKGVPKAIRIGVASMITPIETVRYYQDLLSMCQRRLLFLVRTWYPSKGINKPWIRRNIRPLIPEDKQDASKIVNWILQIAGLSTSNSFEAKRKLGRRGRGFFNLFRNLLRGDFLKGGSVIVRCV